MCQSCCHKELNSMFEPGFKIMYIEQIKSLLKYIVLYFVKKKDKRHKSVFGKNRHAAPPTFPLCFDIAVMAAVAVAAAVSRLCHSSSRFCSISRISAFSSQFCSSRDSIRSRSLAAFAVARCSFFFASSLSSAVWTYRISYELYHYYYI